jgi:hypothetical protein
VVVLGGTNADIAQTIFNKAPLNSQSYGEVTETVLNALSQPREVSFTRATYFDISVKVSYQAKNNGVLTQTETALVIDSLSEYVDSLNIGDEVLLEELKSVCYSSIPSSKRRGITVEVRDLTSSGLYSQTDLMPDYKEKPRLLASNVAINRTL